MIGCEDEDVMGCVGKTSPPISSSTSPNEVNEIVHYREDRSIIEPGQNHLYYILIPVVMITLLFIAIISFWRVKIKRRRQQQINAEFLKLPVMIRNQNFVERV